MLGNNLVNILASALATSLLIKVFGNTGVAYAVIIMTALISWFSTNKINLTTNKSTFSIFKSSRKIIPNLPEVIKFQGLEIKRTPYIKFLGITLDENLSWNQHIVDFINSFI